MPKSSLYHDRDGIATDALRAVLPKYWLYKSPVDIYSHKEYSEDLIIEIVNNDPKRTPTGIEFGIQNKTGVEVWKKHVAVPLDFDDIERLLDLPRQILIHAHDVKTGTSYWLWFNEWYAENYETLQKRDGEISIKIPKKNVLNTRSVKKIRDHVTLQHRLQKIREATSTFARTHAKDYMVHTIEHNASLTTIIYPKHEGAIPVIQALDEVTSAAMIHLIETGEPVPLSTTFSISNLPELILEGGGSTIEAAWLFPNLSQYQPVPVKIELINESDEIALKSSYLLIHIVRPGTIVTEWQGMDTKQKIAYTIIVDRRADSTRYRINAIPPTSDSAKEWANYFGLCDKIISAHQLRITHLENDSVINHSATFTRSNLTPQEEASRSLAEALAFIENTLKLVIPIPKSFTEITLQVSKNIAEILRDGAIKINADEFIPSDAYLICGDSASQARKTLADFEREGTVHIELPSTSANINVELLAQAIDLGSACYACAVKIVNIDELKSVLDKAETTDTTIVDTVFEVDRDEVYLRFERWSANQDRDQSSLN